MYCYGTSPLKDDIPQTSDGFPDGQNWYNYCSNNPINLIDPTGLDATDFYTGLQDGVVDDKDYEDLVINETYDPLPDSGNNGSGGNNVDENDPDHNKPKDLDPTKLDKNGIKGVLGEGEIPNDVEENISELSKFVTIIDSILAVSAGLLEDLSTPIERLNNGIITQIPIKTLENIKAAEDLARLKNYQKLLLPLAITVGFADGVNVAIKEESALKGIIRISKNTAITSLGFGATAGVTGGLIDLGVNVPIAATGGTLSGIATTYYTNKVFTKYETMIFDYLDSNNE